MKGVPTKHTKLAISHRLLMHHSSCDTCMNECTCVYVCVHVSMHIYHLYSFVTVHQFDMSLNKYGYHVAYMCQNTKHLHQLFHMLLPCMCHNSFFLYFLPKGSHYYGTPIFLPNMVNCLNSFTV